MSISNNIKLIISADGKQADRALKDLKAEVASFAGGVVTAGAAIGAAGLAKMAYDLVQVNTEYQRLGASLKTLTGSSAAAGVEFDRLQKFSVETPYQLTEVVGAFTKLKAMGLDPSNEALESYGNTASAMGKDLNMMIEAVADAATGEFERLKEFGIKAKSEGDNVSFTFQGVTTTIKKNAAEISGYLQNIGKTNFAGAMAEQMNTLGGAFSNLQDAYSNLLAEIGSNSGINTGLITAMKDLTATLQDPAFITGLTNIAEIMTKMANAALKIGSFAGNEFFQRASTEKLNAQQVADGIRIKAKALYTPLDEVQAELDASRQMYQYSLAAINRRFDGDPDAAGNKLQLDTAVFPPKPSGNTKNKTTATAPIKGDWRTELTLDTAMDGGMLDLRAKDQADTLAAKEEMWKAETSAAMQIYLDGERARHELVWQLSGEENDLWLLKEQGLTAITQEETEKRLQLNQSLHGNILSGLNSFHTISNGIAMAGGKKAIKTSQMIGAGMGLVSTYSAAIDAMKDPSAITPLQKFANFAMVFGKGMAVVGMINSISAGGGGGRDSGGGGSLSPFASPIVTQPSTQAPAAPAGPSITVQIMGNVIGQDKWVEEELVPALRNLGNRNITITA